MLNFCYCRSVIGDPVLIEACREELDSVLNGTCSSKNLEKLRGYNIYSLRTNRSGRLLFTPYQSQGKRDPDILVLELTKHYNDSRILKSKGALKRFLEHHAEELEAMAADLIFEPFEEPLDFGAEEQVHMPQVIPMDYFNETFIRLSETQELACEMSLPLVVSGGAGTGKTLTLVLRAARDEAGRMLYVTHSHALVESVKRLWADQLVSDETKEAIQFKTYADLLRESYPHHTVLRSDADAPDRVGPEVPTYFLAWYNQYLKKSSLRLKAEHIMPPEVIYCEFRICSGYLREKYLSDFGKKKTSLSSVEERTFVYTAFEVYLDHLRSQHLLDPNFTPLPNLTEFARVFVDEVNDFSQAQLSSFLDHPGVVYTGDSNQMLFDTISVISLLLEQLHDKLGREPSRIQLGVTFRCAKHIASAANLALQVKHQVLGLADKYELRHIDVPFDAGRPVGEVMVLNKKELAEARWVSEFVNTTTFAIVIPEERRAASLQWLRAHGLITPLIFTPTQIKGLEYLHVLILDACSDEEVFEHVTEEVVTQAMDSESASKVHRPKHPKTEANHKKLHHAMNAIYVSLTRAQERVIICNDPNRYNKPFIEGLKSISQEKKGAPLIVAPSSETAWEAHATKLFEHGKIDQVTEIYQTKIMNGEEKLKSFLDARKVVTVPSLVVDLPGPVRANPLPIKGEPAGRSYKKKEAEKVAKPSNLEVLLPDLSLTAFFLLAQENKQAVDFFKAIGSAIMMNMDNMAYLVGSVKNIQEFQSILTGFPLLRIYLLTDVFFERLLLLMIDMQHDKSHEKGLIQASLALMKVILQFKPELILELGTHREGLLCAARLLWSYSLWTHDFLGALWQQLFEQLSEELQYICLGECLVQADSRNALGTVLDDSTSWVTEISGKMWIAVFQAALSLGRVYKDVLLVWAIRHHRENGCLIQSLHACGVSFNEKLNCLNYHMPVHYAAYSGFVDAFPVFKKLGMDLNALSKDNLTPAALAVQAGKVNVLKMLAQLGVDLNGPQASRSLLACIATSTGQISMLKTLKALGVDLEASNEEGLTPVLIAANRGDIDALAELQTLGCDLNKPSNNAAAITACVLALRHTDMATLAALIAWGVDINQASGDGRTPALIAAERGKHKFLNLLQQSGANLSVLDPDGSDLAFIAAQEGHLQMLSLLHEWGLDINKPRADGYTPALAAIHRGYHGVLILIHELKGSLDDLQVTSGSTLAHQAAFFGQLECLVKLKALGLDINRVNKAGFTPIDFATVNQQHKIVRYLQQWYAVSPGVMKQSSGHMIKRLQVFNIHSPKQAECYTPQFFSPQRTLSPEIMPDLELPEACDTAPDVSVV